MAVIWFIVWLIANNSGAHEPLTADPVNAWLATLIIALALDINRQDAPGRRGSA